MKKLTLLFAILCSLHLFAEPQHGVIYVVSGGTGSGASWSDALGNIQEAITQARTQNPDARKDVWIAAGNFTLTENISMQDSINVYGSFAGTETSLDERAKVENGKAWEFINPTILEAEGCRLVQFPATFDVVTVMDGFILTGGNGVGSTTTGNGGGAIMRNNGVLQNCIVKDCEVTNGAGGGIMINGGGVVRYCLIKDNTQKTNANGGGGLFCNTSSTGFEAFIENCEITGNTSTIRGAGLGIQGNSIVYVTNCIIYNNIAADGSTFKHGAGIYVNSTNNRIINNVIYNNTGSNVIYLQAGKFINNTVVKNIGGIYVGTGLVTSEIKNNIVWGCYTDATGVTPTSLSGVAVSGMAVQNNATYNLVPSDKNWNTLDNIQFSSNLSNGDIPDAEFGVGSGPKFVKVSSFFGAVDASQLGEEDLALLMLDLDSVDWSINAISPCVNTGQNVDYVTSDILGENRPQGFPLETAKSDIGAYELPYYLIAFAGYDDTKGQIYDEEGTVLSSENQLGVAQGQNVILYFISIGGTAPYQVSITRSDNGGLTFDGEITDVTSELNEDGLWSSTVYFPFKVTVLWEEPTAIPEIDGNKIRCFATNNSIELQGLSAGGNVSIYNANGSLVKSIKIMDSNLSVSAQAGFYIVRVDNSAKKVMVK